MKSVIFKVYEKILKKVAESVCGEEAADASVAAFVRKVAPKDGVCVSSAIDASTIFRPLAAAVVATKRNSVERRTVRAMLCKFFKWSEMCRMEDQVPGFHIGKNACANGKEDFEKLTSEGVLQTEVRSRERFDQNMVSSAINSILSCDNVVYELGETKRIVLDGKYRDVLAILRKQLISFMWDHYVQNGGDESHMSRSAFYRLCRILTCGEDETRTKARGLLLDDNFNALTRIISDLLPDDRAELRHCLDTLRCWLEYGCFADTSLTSCPRHQYQFGLAACDASNNRDACCGPCQGMQALLTHIETLLKRKRANANAMSVVHDCFEKLELYMGHRLRVMNQQRAVSKMLDSLKKQAVQCETLDEAVVTIDFNVNATPVRFGDKMDEHDDENQTKWHGAMAQFWVADVDATAPAEIYEHKLYYHYVSNPANGQMKYTVAALVEAVLIDIKRDLPHIKRVVIRSENVPAYQNAFVVTLLPLIGFSCGIEVTRFLQSEAEDGKSLLEAQFARATTKVKAWVRQGHCCSTPSEFVAALISDGGIPDTAAEVVEYNGGSLQLLAGRVATMAKSFAALAGRVNDIFYEYDHSITSDSRDTSTLGFDVTRCPSVWVRTFKYSEIGLGRLLELDSMAGTCTLHACEDDDMADPMETIETAVEGNNDETQDRVWDKVANGEEDVVESENDNELDLSSEIVLPRRAVGLVTGVRVISEAQIRRRTRKLPCSDGSVADLPASKEPSHTSQKDMVTYAKKYLLAIETGGAKSVVDLSNLFKEMTTLRYRFTNGQDNLQAQLQQGWAQRPSKERMYGVKYLPRYMNDVRGLFERGGADRHDEMCPARVVEVLQSWDTNRYDVPGENEVRGAISQLRAERCKRGLPADGAFEPRKKHRMEPMHADYFQELVTTRPQVGRKEAVLLFRMKFPEATELYSDARLKSKVSILRGMLPKSTPSQGVAIDASHEQAD
ncbi:hypothetical protein PR003_g15180 [Phytophthora rubi]|uniref:Uncharacterized protein n=1 Tax=Phytophthora rubi TaxID=129364 RepID=A0A6A3KXC2_9STRA|nr:hypothetical protein PR002_g14918 [Phytophthora rubi]KAE9331018.1 hypothetical protein PR003_g15180 [Phytophthora rubi]